MIDLNGLKMLVLNEESAHVFVLIEVLGVLIEMLDDETI